MKAPQTLRLSLAVVSLPLAIAAVAAGCKSEIFYDDPSTTTSSTGTPTTTSTGSGGVCSGYSDQTTATPTKITVVNNTGMPIFLPGQCGAQPRFGIGPSGNPDGNTYGADESCLQTCSDLQQEQRLECGACAPTSFYIPPNSNAVFVWDGTGLTSAQAMPASCYKDANDAAGGCVKQVAAPAGSYNFTVEAYSSCGNGSSCACDSSGLCSGSPSGQQAFSTPVTAAYPGDVTITFDVCAFGCAGD